MSVVDIPAGLSESADLVKYTSGGDSNWYTFVARRLYTNAFIVKDGKILLGMKKRGFGKDMYNGFGGKVEPGETPPQAAHRELQEEAGIHAELEHCGTLLFFNRGAEWAFQIEIFRADDYSGLVTETEEMRPEWFSVPADFRSSSSKNTASNESGCAPAIPYDRMWEDDYIWLPLLLSERPFVGRVDFYQDGDKYKMERWWFGTRP